MSKFNKYAQKVNDIATAAFQEYRKAEKALKDAEETAKQYPQRSGMISAEYAAKSARAHADYLQAKEEMRTAQRNFESHKSEIAALRKDLAAELADHYAADPAALDSNTLELLKSGMLKSTEYVKLMNEAQSKGNYTMARMIAKYAGDAAAAEGKRNGDGSQTARELRAVSYMADQNNGNETLQAFDVMADVYSRAVNNPGLIDHWGDLTGGVIENM